jgi:DNA invertase Pin-like site-specific DNA recombinase
MNEHVKVLPQHLERQAYVYIRQSSPRQVQENLESQDLQYQLVQRAQNLGWPAEQIVVIDDDLGKSAITTTGRQGFQNLVAAVGLGRVGLILVTDVSRLARNCSDWYQLLDLASMWGALISDASGIYDPRHFDDRLLLGLKGAFSEAQWYTQRTQLYAALLNKARRGELALRLPVGLQRLEEGQVIFTPDQAVQQAIHLVFEQFQQQGSARTTLHYFRDNALLMPRYRHAGPNQGQIEWVKPSYQAIYCILKHPAYAGAYTYGKHHRVHLPGPDNKVVVRTLPMDQWAVLIQDVFPAYISWEQYLRNQARMKENAMGGHWTKGAPRSGEALLQGLVLCGRCGRPLHTRYERKPAYACHQANQQYGEPYCQHFTAPHVDQAVVQLFLQALQPAHLETALAAIDQVQTQRHQVAEHWQQRLQRGHYEAQLAQRRYEQVDPDNRLVAAELERLWEEKLQAWRQLELDWSQVQAQQAAPLTPAEQQMIRQLAADVPALWSADTTTPEQRKRLLRCLIADVTLDAFSKPGYSLIYIRWHTGATTLTEAERPGPGPRTPPSVIERIRQLAQSHPDDQVATILNAEGLRTAIGLTWTQARVTRLRTRRGIPTACPPTNAPPGPRGDGLISAAEAAQHLDVTPSMITDWFHQGLLNGHQRQPRSPVWVRLTPDDIRRLNGSCSPAPDMIPLPQAPAGLHLSKQQVRQQIQSERLLTYRLVLNNQWRWFVRPQEKE